MNAEGRVDVLLMQLLVTATTTITTTTTNTLAVTAAAEHRVLSRSCCACQAMRISFYSTRQEEINRDKKRDKKSNSRST